MKRIISRLTISALLNITVAIAFVLAAAFLITLVNREQHKQALIEAQSKARVMLDRNLSTHTYFTRQLKPNLMELTDSVRSWDYFDPTWMSSTYAVREMDNYFKELTDDDYYYKECAINARSPQNEADGYERTFIQDLNKNPDLIERSDIRTIDGKPYFVTLRRGETMEAGCLQCHSTPENAPGDLVAHYGPDRSFGRRVGEVVSAVSIRVPLATAYEHADRLSLLLSGLVLFSLAGLFLVQFSLSRRWLFAPLEMIRSKAMQISTDINQVGERIPLPLGKDLRELTRAFNAMSVSLRRERDLLEDRVEERTAQLAELNAQLQEDIEKRKRAEEALQRSLEEKEILMKELQHRTKNNLGLVASLINLEMNNLPDERSRAIFENTQARIQSMAAIYEQLYRNGSVGNVDLHTYIQRLVDDLSKSYITKDMRVEIQTELDKIEIDIKQAVPLGIILNELITNAIKYAYPPGTSGQIRVELKGLNGEIIMRVVDHGKGVSTEKKSDSNIGLGLKLVEILTKQINGSFMLESNNGTTGTVKFVR